MTQYNLAADRDTIVANAVRARKIAADRADDYKRMFDANPDGIAHLLTAPVEKGGLMAGLVPEGATADGYPTQWLGGAPAAQGTVNFEDPQTAVQATSAAGPPPVQAQAPLPPVPEPLQSEPARRGGQVIFEP